MTALNLTWYAIMNKPFNYLLPAAALLLLMLLPSTLMASGAGDSGSSIENGRFQNTIPPIEPVVLNGRKLKVIATTSFIADVLSEIAGNETEITTLMPRGQNPHSWEPGPGDIAAVDNADLIFINGFGLEENLLNIIGSMNTAPVIPVSSGVETLAAGNGEHGDEHSSEAANPHVWFSPLNVMVWTKNIQSALSLADPEHSAEYQDAAASYLTRLKALDEEIRVSVSTLTAEERKVVTDHSSFDYFARDYGFVIAGKVISSSNDQAKPSARDIAALTELVKKESIKALFVGGTAGTGLKRLAASVSAESGRHLPVVELLAGSLANAGERGDSYLDFERYNTELIVAALEAQGDEK